MSLRLLLESTELFLMLSSYLSSANPYWVTVEEDSSFSFWSSRSSPTVSPLFRRKKEALERRTDASRSARLADIINVYSMGLSISVTSTHIAKLPRIIWPVVITGIYVPIAIVGAKS